MYAIFDIALDCDMPLPELSEIETAEVVINVKAGTEQENIPEQPIWFHHWKDPDENILISCSKHDNAYLLRFPELVDFVISESGESVKYFPKPCLAAETIRHLLLDQVIPTILGHQGRFVLHASAVEALEDESIAFIGETGLGKSTLASSFYQNGAKLLTDDCLLLDEQDRQMIGMPNYYGVRLYDDSATAILGQHQPLLPVAHYSTKNRFYLASQSRKKQHNRSSLVALFLLTESLDNDEIVITPIKGAEELIAIIKHTFELDVADKLSINRQFKNISNLMSSNIKIFQLQYPRKYQLLPTVREQIRGVL